METSNEVKQSEIKKRVVAIDFLRVASLFIIILFHFNVQMILTKGASYSLTWNGNPYIDMGQIGVGIFIILSGYSIMLTSKNISTFSFYKKRLLRIYPVFYISYIACLLCILIVNSGISFQASGFSFLLTIIGFDSYFAYRMPTYYLSGEWFIGAIISLYAIFPIINIAFKRNRFLSFIVVIIFYFFNHHFYSKIYNIEEWHNIITILFLFSFGVYFQSEENDNKFKFLLTSSLLSGCYLYFIPTMNLIFTKMIICVLLFSLSILILNIFNPFVKNIRFISKIANLCFPIFLVHHIIIFLVTGNMVNITGIQNRYEQFILSLLLSSILGFACLKIESCMLRNAIHGK